MNNKNLLDNEELAKEFIGLKNAEEMKAFFEKNDMHLAEGCSYEDVFEEYKKALESESEELSEKELENAAGGVWLIAGCIVGVGVAVGGGFAVAGAVKYAKRKLGL